MLQGGSDEPVLPSQVLPLMSQNRKSQSMENVTTDAPLTVAPEEQDVLAWLDPGAPAGGVDQVEGLGQDAAIHLGPDPQAALLVF